MVLGTPTQASVTAVSNQSEGLGLVSGDASPVGEFISTPSAPHNNIHYGIDLSYCRSWRVVAL